MCEIDIKRMLRSKDIEIKSKISAESLFKISRMKEVIKPTNPHKHDNYHELIFLEKGAGYHTIDAYSHEIVNPIVFYLKPGQVHCWDFTIIPKGYVILFKDLYLDVLNLSVTEKLGSKIQLDKDDFIFKLCADMYENFTRNDFRSNKVIQSTLKLLLIRLLDKAEKGNTFIKPNEIILSFQQLLRSDENNGKSVIDYANLLNITLKRLNENCRNYFGRSASEIIKEKTLSDAKNYLLHTGKSIDEISWELHFNDSSNFIKFFKKHTSLTPGRFREANNS